MAKPDMIKLVIPEKLGMMEKLILVISGKPILERPHIPILVTPEKPILVISGEPILGKPHIPLVTLEKPVLVVVTPVVFILALAVLTLEVVTLVVVTIRNKKIGGLDL
jgi:hypothetical protein